LLPQFESNRNLFAQQTAQTMAGVLTNVQDKFSCRSAPMANRANLG
jgi:hypothetical protein